MMRPVTRRPLAAVSGLVGALVVGGVAQTFLWRWGLDGVGSVVGSQFTWVLLTFAVAWAWAEGRLLPGVAAGALTGLALVVSYYATQWLVDGRHAATEQFTDTGGLAWTVAAVGGGAVMGILGAMAGQARPSRARWRAVGITTPAVLVGAGPLLWLATQAEHLQVARVLWAAVVFGLVALALLAVAVRVCGPVASLQGLVVSAALGLAALGALLVLQTGGWLYLTF